MTDLSKLKTPFPPDRISWRVGSTTADKKRGMALAYIDARDVMERLDEVCGPGGWQCAYPHATGKTVCSIGVKVENEWVWKSDGAGDTDFEADKGALSDAFKRAAVRWGVGRYLYDVDAPWVEIEPMGKSFKIAASELPKLRALLNRSAPEEPGWKTRANKMREALKEAARPDDIDKIIASYGVSLKEIKEASPDAYDWLMKAAETRKGQLMASAA
jgi:hypothetical protein